MEENKTELSYNLIQGNLVDIKMWTKYVPVESGAIDQLRNLSSLPIVFKHVASMPDCHIGNGTTVGTVLATKGAVIPSAVGVDIGCGMIACRLSLKSEDLPIIFIRFAMKLKQWFLLDLMNIHLLV